MKFKIKQSPNTLAKTGIAFVAASILLTGCWNSDDNADDETTVSLRSAEPSTASPTQYIPASKNGPAQNVPQPKMPEAVHENTTEGAEAALQYFWEGYQYLRETGKTSHIMAISRPECEFCSNTTHDMQKLYGSNKWLGIQENIHTEQPQDITDTSKDNSPVSRIIEFTLVDPPTEYYDAGIMDPDIGFSEFVRDRVKAGLFFDETIGRWQITWIGKTDEGAQ